MGIRESLNQNRTAGLAVTVGTIALAAVALLWFSGNGSAAGKGMGQAFYTVDDGATWFTEDAGKIPPFDHKGQQAVLCYVYKCGPDGKPWVSHLMRYTSEGKKQREERRSGGAGGAGAGGGAGGGPVDLIGTENFMRANIEVKEAKTGDKDWVRISDPRAAGIQELKCPDGSAGEIMPVDPNG